MTTIFIRIDCEYQHKDRLLSRINSFVPLVSDISNIKVYPSLDEEQADYISHTIEDNLI